MFGNCNKIPKINIFLRNKNDSISEAYNFWVTYCCLEVPDIYPSEECMPKHIVTTWGLNL
jgi:hypothetical protein